MNVKENEKEKKNLSCWFFYPETKKKKLLRSLKLLVATGCLVCINIQYKWYETISHPLSWQYLLCCFFIVGSFFFRLVCTTLAFKFHFIWWCQMCVCVCVCVCMCVCVSSSSLKNLSHVIPAYQTLSLKKKKIYKRQSSTMHIKIQRT